MTYWFNQVLYNGDMGIHYTARMFNKFLYLQKKLEDTERTCHRFNELYRIAYPKVKSILKLLEKTQEKELGLIKDDHWLEEIWQIGLDHRKEVLERGLQDVQLDLQWVVKHQTDSEGYLKMPTDYDMFSLELDLEKIKPLFHKKMEQGETNVLSLDFMDFIARAFT